MYKLGNPVQKNEIQYNPKNILYNKMNYLTDSSCSEIQEILRKDYFSRLQKASLNNLLNYVTEDDANFKTNKNMNLDDLHKKPIKYAAKQILFSDKVRKNNFNRIKKYPRRSLNLNDKKTIPVLKKTDSIQDLLYNSSDEDKKTLVFKPKKVYIDKYPISYDLNYIDEVEEKFIKPYLSKNTIVYHDYITNKKSKTPFNFIIG